jgi:hypothetical protein
MKINLMAPWRNRGFVIALLISTVLGFFAVKGSIDQRERYERTGRHFRDVTFQDSFSGGIDLTHVAEAQAAGILLHGVAFCNLILCIVWGHRKGDALGWLLTFPVVGSACMVLFWWTH